MSALKITERKTDWLESDPYELFELAETQERVRGRAEFYGAAIVGALIAAVISLAVVWSFYHTEQTDQILPYAYLEIKAIDPDGRPVVGALVKTDGEPAGNTDAFGEWRRFMKVPLGGRVALTMMKNTEEGMLSSVKTLEVPGTMPETGDIEVIDRIQLTYLSHKPESSKPKPAALTSVAVDRAPLLKVSAAGSSTAEGTHYTQATDVSANASSAPRSFDRVWFVAASKPTTESAGDALTSDFLGQQVLKEVRHRASQLGLILDPAAPWRIAVQHVSVDGLKGLIRTQATYHASEQGAGEPLYAFLTNYNATAVDTARTIMYRIAQHTPVEVTAYRSGIHWYVPMPTSPLWRRNAGSLFLGPKGETLVVGEEVVAGDHLLLTMAGDPCAGPTCKVRALTVPLGAPNPDWETLPLRLHGAKGKAIEAYVAGIAAVPVSPGIYSFWGQPDQGSILTVLSNGNVIYRGKIVASRAQGAQISLPVGTISRR